MIESPLDAWVTHTRPEAAEAETRAARKRFATPEYLCPEIIVMGLKPFFFSRGWGTIVAWGG